MRSINHRPTETRDRDKNETLLNHRFAGLCISPSLVLSLDLSRFVDGEIPGLVSTYKGIHTHPEFSHHEEKTAALLATLRNAGFTVTEHVGKYPDG